MKLHEMTGAMLELSKMDLDDEAVSNTLDCIQGDFNDKAVSIIKFAENLEADTTIIDAEIERLKARKSVIVSRKNKLREYLLKNMEASGITKIECPLFTASIRKGSESVEIEDESALPDEFVKAEVVTKPDKNAIKAALKSGAEVTGARLVRGQNTIVIK